jgi:osmoprotectant transport system ATP-binding protein
VIAFDGVTKCFHGGSVAVDSVDLTARAGETLVLVGPSGCGKTTSLRMINRLIEPTSGRILLDGKDVRKSDPALLRRGIGYVIQQAGLFPHRTIEDNIGTVPVLLGWRRSRARARAAELMELVGLTPDLASRYPHQLSGGQQQRVGVARALAADPPVLLMDEPFSAVDPLVRASLQDELIKLQSKLHKTVVLVTHDIEEAIKLGDQVAIFRPGGKLAQMDPPERLLSSPADDYVERFIGFDRGIRRLSFVGAEGLTLDREPVVAHDMSAADALTVAEQLTEPWLLVVDAQRRPLGWAAAAELALAARDLPVGDMTLTRYGHTFAVRSDSLRAVLDATVLSSTGRAVGVDADGRVAGVTSYERLRAAIHDSSGCGSPQLAPGRAMPS